MLHQKHPRKAAIFALLLTFLAGDYLHSIHLLRVAIVKSTLFVATAVSEPEQPATHKNRHSTPQLALWGAQ